MDIIDNIVYANLKSRLLPNPPASPILSDFVDFSPIPADPTGVGTPPIFSYSLTEKIDYCSFGDSSMIEKATHRHWYDINAQVSYDSGGVTPFGSGVNGVRFVSFERTSTYNLIYGYLLENTRMLQIFERLLEKFLYDEEFGIADNSIVFNWIQNAEQLFFKNESITSYNSIRFILYV